MTKTDQRKTKAELIAELGIMRAHLAGMCDACNVSESDERYRRLVQFLPDAIRVACNNTIVYVNDAAVTLFRASGPDDLIGRNTQEFVLPEEQEVVEARRRALYANKVLPTAEQRRFALDGGILNVELKSMVISWQGKLATLTVMRDISSRIRNRAALVESEQRLAAVAENIPGVTFQCVLHGNGRFSYPYISPSAQSLFGVEAGEIMRNGLALQRCIHPDDRKGVRSSVRVLKRRADTGKLNLAVRVVKKLPHIKGDERRIKQILLNLLSNASKFTPDGGTIRVTADIDTASALRIRIADTGIGIAEKDMARVLEPFGQVRGPVKGFSEGTGLGLPLTKSLVERHGGKLSLRSRLGRGTTITVRFPPRRLVA